MVLKQEEAMCYKDEKKQPQASEGANKGNDDSKGLDGTLSGQLMTQKTQNTPGIYFVFFIHHT